MPRNNSLWAVIEELRAEIEQIETHYENACANLQEVEVELAKKQQIIEDQKNSMDMFMSGTEKGNREDKADGRVYDAITGEE
jgi:iron only hydrogenase large subunit-like protein